MSGIPELVNEGHHVRVVCSTHVYTLNLPNQMRVRVGAEQIPLMTIEPHGNHGRSRVTLPVTVELEVCGGADELKRDIAKTLALLVKQLHEQNYGLEKSLREERARTGSAP